MNIKKLLDRILILLRPLTGYVLRQYLGEHFFAVIAQANGGLFAVNLEDRGVHYELRHLGAWEPDYLDRLKRHLTPESNVLVVGAHIGSLAVPLAKRCRKMVAIEPNPVSFELLTLNLRLNRVANGEAFNVAANNEEGALDFICNRLNSGGSKRVPKIKAAQYYYDDPAQIAVPAVRLDDYLTEKDFTLILMDIEGSEYFALQGMQEILQRARVLAIEFLPDHLQKVSGVSVAEFLSVIAPHFATLTVPSKGYRVDASRFLQVLDEMYARGEGDEEAVSKLKMALI